MLYWPVDTDAAWVRRALGGKAGAFEVLVERYYPAARAIGLGITRNAADAEDVAQEAFLQAYLKLSGLQEPKKFAGWVGTIARNVALRLVEKRQREQPLDAVAEEQAVPAHAHAEEELARLASELLEQLEEEARDTLWLHYFGGYSAREIAAMQGISRDAALKRLQRAREALGERLLSRIGAPPSRRAVSLRQKQAIATAVAASGLLYGRSAAAATASAGIWGLGGGAGAWLAGLGAVVALLLAGFGVFQWRGGDEELPNAATTAVATPEAAPTLAGATLPVAEAGAAGIVMAGAPGQAEDDTSTGDGMLYLRVFDAQNRPVAGAEVVVERVEWPLELLPPAKTVRREGKSDAAGRVVFEELPEGSYGVFVWTANGVDAGTLTLADYQNTDTQNMYLKPGVPVSGRLVDAAGAPIVGAYLYPYTWMGQQIIGSEEQTALRQQTDAEGQFRFPMLLPGTWQFAVQPRDRVGGVSEAVATGDEAVEVVLPAPGKLEGRCEWAGAPGSLEEARVEVGQIENPRAKYSAPVAVDGSYRIEALMAGDYNIEVTGSRVALAEAQKANVAAGRVSQLNLPVSRGHDVVVKALDEGGLPAAGVKLTMRLDGAYWKGARDGVTDADGICRFDALGEGKWTLVPRPTPGYIDSMRDQFREFELAGKPSEQQMEIKATRGVRVSGVVRDPQGVAVAGAFVVVSGQDNSKQIHLHTQAVSGAGGAFVIDDAQPLAGARFKALKGSWASTPQSVDILDTGVSGVEIRLDTEVLTALEVRLPGVEPDFLGNEDSRREVVLNRLDDYERLDMEQTDLGGRCTFSHVPVGIYSLHIQDESGALRGCGVERFEVIAGKEFQEVDLSCGASGGLSISGRVVDLRGTPIVGAELTAGEMYETVAQGRSGEGGRFTLEGLSSGAVRIRVTSKRYATADVFDVEAGSRDVEIVMEDRGQLRGRVIDGQTRQPLAGVSVTVGRQYEEEQARGESGEDGSFSVANIAPGDVRVRVNKVGYMTAMEYLPLAAGEAVKDVEFALMPSAKLRGRVLDDSGEPVAGAQVTCGEFGRDGRALSREDGAYEITLSDARVHVSASGYAGEIFTAPTAGGERDVVLKATGRIVGEVLRAEGVPHLSVSGRFSDGSSLHAEVTDGKFELSGPAGPATILLDIAKPLEGRPGSFQQVRAVAQQVNVTARGEVAVAFDLSQTGNASLRVKVIGAESLREVRISASQADVLHGGYSTAEATARDEYLLDGLEPGRYTLSFGGRGDIGAEWREMKVDVAAGANPPLVIDLGQDTGSLVGQVRGEVPNGVWCELTIAASGGVFRRSSRISADGRFNFEGLPAGRGNIQVSQSGMRGVKAAQSFEIRSGETTEITLDLSGEGVLVLTRGEASDWMSVSLVPVEARAALAAATRMNLREVLAQFPVIDLSLQGGQGHARFEGLPVGDFLVVLTGRGLGEGEIEMYEVVLSAGVPQEVVLP